MYLGYALENTARRTAALHDNTVRKLWIEDYYQVLDSLRGVKAALDIKRTHIEMYSHACISEWAEISLESDMRDVDYHMGRVASFSLRFCRFKNNMQLCGMIYLQYITLAILRDSLRMASMTVVRNARYFNQQYKLKGLTAEFKKAMELDKTYLQPLLTDQYCHMTCAIKKIDHYGEDILETEFYTADSLGLGENAINLMKSYFSRIGIENYFRIEDGEIDKCQKCYKQGVKCRESQEAQCDNCKSLTADLDSEEGFKELELKDLKVSLH